MIHFKKLAIAGAIAASIMGANAAEAHVTYNMAPILTSSNPANIGKLNTANGNAAAGVGVWTDGAVSGYVGHLPVTWAAFVHNDSNPNASYTVSNANAVADAASASVTVPSDFNIASLNNKWNPANSWGNALDFGLIDLHASGNLLIRVEADASQSSVFTPGFTLFSGWDTSPSSSKHGSWNVALPAVPVNPRGTTGLTYVGQASTNVAGGYAEYLFTNLTAGHYSLWIGGNGTGNTTTNQSYIANLTASPVPVPGAVWLFGSAMAGLLGIKRKSKIVA